MRVIAGEKRGLKLYTLEGDNTRPTLDRVKENLFNILGSKIHDSNILDLFGGSGNLSIEALSRGAKHVIINDISKESIKVINKNIALTKYIKCVTILQNDYKKIICQLYTKGKKFDIIFIDAPYQTDMGIDAINQINTSNILMNNGIIILESDFKSYIPETIESIECFDTRKYGNTKLSFWRRRE